MKRDQLLVPGQYCSIPHAVLSDRRLSPLAKLAYSAILNHLGGNDHTWPSYRTLADEIGCSRSGVVAAITQLAELKYCEIKRRLDGWTTSNRYVLLLPEQTSSNPERVPSVEQERVPSVEHHGLPVEQERVPSVEHSCTAERTLVYRPSNIRVPRNEQGCSTDGTEPLKRTTKEEPPHSNHSNGTTSLSPASRVPSPAATEQEGEQESPADSKEEGGPMKSDQAYLALAKAWKKAGYPLPSKDRHKVLLERFKIQNRSAVRKLQPQAVMAAIERHGLELSWEELFQENGRGWIWEKLNRGSKPSRKKSKKDFSKEDIETIYDSYPRHVKKPEALREIRNALNLLRKNRPELPIEEHVAWMLERVKRFAESKAGNSGQYTPYPSNWFSQGRYLDDPDEWDAQKDRSGNIKRIIDPNEEDSPGISEDELFNLDMGAW